MELTREQAQERLRSPNNLSNILKKYRESEKISHDIFSPTINVNPGRQLARLPKEAKSEILERSNSGTETQKEIAKKFGITQAAVSHIKRTREKEIEDSLTNEDREKELRAKRIAVDKMLIAMGLITEERLNKVKTWELAQTAKNLSGVFKDLTKEDRGQGAQVNLTIYAPEVRSEESYKVIEIK